MKNKSLIKKLLSHLPFIAGYIRQADELKRCRNKIETLRSEIDLLIAANSIQKKDLETLRSEIDRLNVVKTNQDFLDFTDFCRRHDITIED